MSREIKFRVWDKKRRELTYQKWAIAFNDKTDYQPITIHGFDRDNAQDFDFEIQQFTGIKDKNGREIYEGDLINFTVRGVTHGPESEYETNAEVWYSEEDLQFVFGKFKGKLHSGEEYAWWYSMADRIDPKSIEVVGNIFENNLK